MASSESREHILWQDELGHSWSVAVVDIPRSIEEACNEGDSIFNHRVTSCAHIETPYKLPEPVGESARSRLQSQHPESAEHSIYVDGWHEASKKLANHGLACWHLPRHKTHASGSAAEHQEHTTHERIHNVTTVAAKLTAMSPNGAYAYKHDARTGIDETEHSSDLVDFDDWPVIHNISTHHVHFGVGLPSSYYLPPHSSVVCEEITAADGSSALRQAFRRTRGSAARFNLVIMDPPWQNASVKRSRRYSTMLPMATVDLLVATDLDMLMADQCLVGVWITNKPSAREAILGEDGMFAQWGVQHVEEIVWYKITSNGELIFPMSSITRKPYEILLIGRKHRSYPVPPLPKDISRRTLIAVPDLHSRKPCLKALLEPMISHPCDYKALEVFARHLVAGWWSWGNECMLYNGSDTLTLVQ